MPMLSTRTILAATLLLTGSVTQAQQPETFTNSLGIDFVQIPTGSFRMGSPGSDPKAARNASCAVAVGIRRAMAGAVPRAATTTPIIAASASAFGLFATLNDGDFHENYPQRI
ncbi:hypothetical protein [Paracoccus xiamenensis]|nr:hypothetical protein [Paracoccus xiamenensis]